MEEKNSGATPAAEKRGFWGKTDAFFGISKNGSDFKTEIIAGITTFMSVVYALLAVPRMYGAASGVSFNAIYIATALGAVMGTTLMAFIAKMPLAQASGMGATAYVTGTLLASEMGLTYANAMIFVLFDGIIFLLLTVTGLRKRILTAIPDEVKIAVPVGIGMFISLLGFQSSGLVVFSEGNISLSSFNILSDGFNYFNAMGALIALLGVIAIAFLAHKKVKGGILFGMLGCTALYYILIGLGCAWSDADCVQFFKQFSMDNPFTAFADWGKQSAGKVFVEGFDFGAYLGIPGHNAGTLAVVLLTSALSLCMLDMFDTIGTLYGACVKGNLIDADGNPIRMDRCMLCDSLATVVGSVFGATTVTTYVESSSGVAAGGKTGFASLISALCFALTLFLSPIANLIPSSATSAALIWVGVLMMSSVVKIDWDTPLQALPAFLTMVIMAFGYSISKGIGVGIISCVILKLLSGKVREISIIMWVIFVLFLLMFILTN